MWALLVDCFAAGVHAAESGTLEETQSRVHAAVRALADLDHAGALPTRLFEHSAAGKDFSQEKERLHRAHGAGRKHDEGPHFGQEVSNTGRLANDSLHEI
jgi:hypothetical protein